MFHDLQMEYYLDETKRGIYVGVGLNTYYTINELSCFHYFIFNWPDDGIWLQGENADLEQFIFSKTPRLKNSTNYCQF